jgi:hypothetical protein
MDRVTLFDHYKTMGRDGIVFMFKGSMSQALLVKFGDMIREDLFMGSKRMSEIRAVFSVFVELAQNINRYSAERPETGLVGGDGSGIIVVSESEGSYTVASGNQIEKSRLGFILPRLEMMKGLNSEALRKLYREQIKQASPPEGSVGAGLGLFDIAKRSGGGLNYAVHPISDEVSFIELFVEIKKEASAASQALPAQDIIKGIERGQTKD